jgi:hypothetical protein
MEQGFAASPRTDSIRRLSETVRRDLEQKNRARILVDLPPIEVKVRKCVVCGSSFESIGNRACGCAAAKPAGFMAGREII